MSGLDVLSYVVCVVLALFTRFWAVKSIYVGFVDDAQNCSGVCMSAFKWFLAIVFFIGIAMFLYGSNYPKYNNTDYYDPVVGWIGVALAAAGLVGLLLLYVHGALASRDQGQKS